MSETEVRKQEETMVRRRQHILMLVAPTCKKYQKNGMFYQMTLDSLGKNAADTQAEYWIKRLAKAAQEAQCDMNGNPL